MRITPKTDHQPSGKAALFATGINRISLPIPNLRGKQPIVFFFDDRITFAGALLQAVTVEHCDAPSRVPDESRVLQLIAPSVILTVTQENGDLYAQLRNAPEMPIYPESKTEFFYKAFYAQINFVTDGTGRAAGLVFRHDGRDTPAQRLD
jgi:hypothetical protein